MVNDRKIDIGHTNKEKYIKDNKFYKVKDKNEFNHNIDYKELNIFDFAPKVFEDTEKVVVTEALNASMISDLTKEDLIQIGKNMRTVHLSDAKFPRFNLRRRVKSYQKQIHAFGKRISIIEDYYKDMMKLISRMNQLNNCHNDLWWQNILKDQNGKIWFVDWEYATRGDKHFDLAFFIESQKLNKEDEEVLIKAYESIDGVKVIQEWIILYKRFAHWLTLIWAYAQDPVKLPFDVDWIEKKFYEYTRVIEENKKAK